VLPKIDLSASDTFPSAAVVPCTATVAGLVDNVNGKDG
jgi:hypothetical protein